MKIFISWSGDQSKAVALLLKPWLKKVLQAANPWMSDEDIEPGTRWGERIAKELAVTEFGILCVTADNRSSEWLNFEAGALSMAISDVERRVVPLLIGFEKRGDLGSGSPLAAYNTLVFNEDDMWKLIGTINEQMTTKVELSNLRESFDFFWPKLQESVAAIDIQHAPKRPEKRTPEYLQEILNVVEDIRRRQESAQPAVEISDLDAMTEFIARYSRPQRLGGPEGLSAKERNIIQLVRVGFSYREIAQTLGTSVRTVEGHMHQIFTKFGVTSRAELAAKLSDIEFPRSDQEPE